MKKKKINRGEHGDTENMNPDKIEIGHILLPNSLFLLRASVLSVASPLIFLFFGWGCAGVFGVGGRVPL